MKRITPHLILGYAVAACCIGVIFDRTTDLYLALIAVVVAIAYVIVVERPEHD